MQGHKRTLMSDIKGVEIFAEGKWNGNTVNSKVLSDIVEAFEATKEFFKPVLKLGHDDSQEMLKAEGLPAAGWISSIYIKGTKLFADFTDIPQKVFELIQKKAYRKVSVEIFRGYTFKDRIFDNLLGAVALLGADTPAVLTLNDILGRYKLDVKKFADDGLSNKIDVKMFMMDVKGDDMDQENDQVNYEKELSDIKDKVNKAQLEKKTVEDNFQAYKKETDDKISALQVAKAKADTEKFSVSLRAKNLASPSMVPLIEALFETKDSYTVGDKKLSKEQLIEEILKLAKETALINMKEGSSSDVPKSKTPDDLLEEKIAVFQKDHPKVSYSEAYKEVSRELRGH